MVNDLNVYKAASNGIATPATRGQRLFLLLESIT